MRLFLKLFQLIFGSHDAMQQDGGQRGFEFGVAVHYAQCLLYAFVVLTKKLHETNNQRCTRYLTHTHTHTHQRSKHHQ
jgi:hypothetical protein